jgi:hypothetical protein
MSNPEPPAPPKPPAPAPPDPTLETPAKANEMPPAATVEPKSFAENVKIIGGLLALGLGLFILLAIVVTAIIALPASQAGAAATAGITALGSMVGAYFGVKVGSDGTKEAIEGQKEEATKAQAFALGVEPSKTPEVFEALSRMTGGKEAGEPKPTPASGASSAQTTPGTRRNPAP